jgi:hypothetical protein
MKVVNGSIFLGALYLESIPEFLTDIDIVKQNLSGFWSWGGGGEILKVEHVEIKKV